MGFSEVKSVFLDVYKNKVYFFISLFIAFLFYAINIFFISWNFLPLSDPSFFSSFFYFLFSVPLSMKIYSFLGLILISILIGILSSLIFYKVNFLKSTEEKKASFFGVIGSGGVGAFLGIFATGCAACGVGFVSLLGLGAGFISFFPWGGFEFSLASIFILIFAIFKISKNMYVCSFKRKDKIHNIYK